MTINAATSKTEIKDFRTKLRVNHNVSFEVAAIQRAAAKTVSRVEGETQNNR